LGFTKTDVDSNFYYLVDDSNMLVLALYVEDLILIGSSEKFVACGKVEMAREFDMKDISYVNT